MYNSPDFVDLDTFKVANILACLPQHIRQPLIDSLQEFRPNIGYLSIRFEDLEQTDDAGLKALIEAVDYQDLVLAMSAANEQLILRFSDNLPNQTADKFITDVKALQKTEGPEQFFKAFDAKINVITMAAKLRQSGEMSVTVNDNMVETIPDDMVNEIKAELQLACEKAMAEVLACYLPHAAAAVLCQRLDRGRILQQMLQLDDNDFCDTLNDDEIEELLCGLTDKDVF